MDGVASLSLNGPAGSDFPSDGMRESGRLGNEGWGRFTYRSESKACSVAEQLGNEDVKFYSERVLDERERFEELLR